MANRHRSQRRPCARRPALRRALKIAIPHAILIAFSAAILLPLLWVLRVSLTDKVTAYRIPPEWTPPKLDNYVEIFSAYPFATWFTNSVVVALASTAIALPLATAMAYAFARFNTGGHALRLGVLSSQMLPPVILVLPLFTLFLTAGLLNTHLALIVAHLTINVPFLAWLLVAFFEGEAKQLEEAARVEGCTRFQAFVHIAVPVAAPGILAAGLLGFISELERVPARADPLRQGDQHPAGRALGAGDASRRRDRAAGRGDPVRRAAGLPSVAVPAQISDQGALARRPQIAADRS